MARTLFIIDGYAQIFRAYYAIRGGMHSPVTSEPTHAVFGYTGMLLKLYGQLKPDYVAVALDAPGGTFRDTLFPQYKGTRQATPEDLISQIPRILELSTLFGMPLLSVPGLEADDIIATLAHTLLAQPENSDLQIKIISKDKDLEQLLSPQVQMVDIHKDTVIDEAALWESKGIRPDQVIDLLSLTGDTVDNVPGVDGVGIKTAAKLIGQFGSLDGIYANLSKLSDKQQECFERARGHIELSRTLVTLKRDAEIPFDLEQARAGTLQLEPLLALFKQLGFNRFQDELRKLAGDTPVRSVSPAPSIPIVGVEAPARPSRTGEYRCIITVPEMQALVTELAKQDLIAVDTETTGLARDAALVGISLAWEAGKAVYIPVRSPNPLAHLSPQQVLAALKPILEGSHPAKCGHNLKFDAITLLRAGIHLRGVVFDSMLAGVLMDPGRASARLDSMAQNILKLDMIPISHLIGTGSDQLSMETVPLEQITPYAAEDADAALQLAKALRPSLEEMGMTRLLEQVEAPLTTVLAEMEHNGIVCDPVELVRQGDELRLRVDELRGAIFIAAGCEFQIESTRQLSEVLFDTLGLAAGKKTKTGRSTDIEVLQKLADQEERGNPASSVPRLVIEYRQLTKLINTYLVNLREAVDPKTRRIHSTFHQLVTATGRLASHGPNLQNIPVRSDVGRQIRKAFLADEGKLLICADYSQIELRVLAHCSQDAALISAFERDEDIHTAVAAQVFGVEPEQVTREQRSHAKTINFGIIYGVTAFGLARRIEGLDQSSAARLIADYKARFAGIDRFMRECVHQAATLGYVTTLLGRRRYIPEVGSTNPHTRSLGERLAINSVIQGTAADLIKIAMVRVRDRIDSDGSEMLLLLQIHDELVLECAQAEAAEQAEHVQYEMEHAMDLSVPLKASVGLGRDWFSAK